MAAVHRLLCATGRKRLSRRGRLAYSSLHRNVATHLKEPYMFTKFSTQIASFGLATLITLVMLSSVNYLAEAQPSADRMAQAHSLAKNAKS
jgi:hypothetical protein